MSVNLILSDRKLICISPYKKWNGIKTWNLTPASFYQGLEEGIPLSQSCRGSFNSFSIFSVNCSIHQLWFYEIPRIIWFLSSLLIGDARLKYILKLVKFVQDLKVANVFCDSLPPSVLNVCMCLQQSCSFLLNRRSGLQKLVIDGQKLIVRHCFFLYKIICQWLFF